MQNANAPVFSVIIPHYGIPELLRRCLASIPQREDLQVIVVDDQSPDYDTYRERFPDLFREGVTWLRTSHNGGAGLARNVGLEESVGKWLLFADADDFFTEEMEELLDEDKDAEEDVIYFRHRCVLSDRPDEKAHRDKWMEGLFDRYFESGDDREIRFEHCVPWAKMIRRSLVEEYAIRFDEVRYSNDVMFNTIVGSKARAVRVVNRPLYVLTERSGSLTAGFARKPGELQDRAEVTLRAQKLMNECGYSHPITPFSDYLRAMVHRDRRLFLEYFTRIPEVYDSYWQPLREMAAKEEGALQRGLLYGFSLYAYCRGSLEKRFRNAIGATKKCPRSTNSRKV
jgi:Glycosyltransferases involved in cell wall biogenesis